MRLLPFVVSACLFAACGGSGPGSSACTGEGRELWDCRGPENYSLTVTRNCFCYAGGQPVLIEVRGGLVVSATFVESGEPVPEDTGLRTTVEDLFRAISEWDSGNYRVRVEYDPGLGYPIRIDVDCIDPIPDCGIQILAEVVPRGYVLPGP